MIRLLTILLAVALLSCQNSNTTRTNSSDTTTTTGEPKETGSTVRVEEVNEPYFYKRLEGTIAGQPVVMNLVKNGKNLKGSYYYRKAGGLITVTGDEVSNGMQLREQNMDGNAMEPQLKVIFNGSKLEGTWTSGDKKKTYPIELEEKYPSGAVQFDYRHMADSIIAYPDLKDSPKGTISIGYLVPKENNSIVTQTIKEMLDGKHGKTAGTPEQTIEKIKSEYFAAYKKDIKEREQYDMPRNSPSNSFERMQDMSVAYNENGYLVLEDNFYEYTGGAHGMHGNLYYCIDLKTNRRMKLADIMKADSAAIAPIMAEYLRKAYSLGSQPLTAILFDNYLLPNDNFYFNEKGIGFWYNPYEVAAYAQGYVHVFIPFSRLMPFLVPDFRQRIGL